MSNLSQNGYQRSNKSIHSQSKKSQSKKSVSRHSDQSQQPPLKSKKTIKQQPPYDENIVVRLLAEKNQTVAKYEEIFKYLRIHEQIISKGNLQMGRVSQSVDMSKPKDKDNISIQSQNQKVMLLPELFNTGGNSKTQDKFSQKVLITRAYKYKYHPCSYFPANEPKIIQDMKRGIIDKTQSRNKTCVLVVFYKQGLYEIQGDLEIKPKSDFTILSKNRITQKLQFRDNKQIHIQLRHPSNLAQNKGSFLSIFQGSKGTNLLGSSTQSQRLFRQCIVNFNKEYKKVILNKFQQQEKNTDLQQNIYRFHYTYKTMIEDMLAIWDQEHTKNKDVKTKDRRPEIKSDFRVGVISKINKNMDIDLPMENYYFYHKWQDISYDISPQKSGEYHFRLNLQCLDRNYVNETEIEVRKLKQILLLNVISTNNKNSIQKFGRLQTSMQKAIRDDFMQKIFKAAFAKSNQMQSLKDQAPFQKYQTRNIRDMINNWKVANSKLRKNKKLTYVCMAIHRLHFTQQYKCIRMNCSVLVNKDKEEKKSRTFEYQLDNDMGQEEGGCNVRLEMIKDQARTMIFEVDSKKKYIPIEFTFEQGRIDKSKNSGRQSLAANNSFFSKIQISRNQMYNNGGNMEVEINNQNKPKQISGFMEIFIVVKKHFNRKILERYDFEMNRNIQVLKKMGSLSPHYYEPTSIKYVPSNYHIYSLLAFGRVAPTIEKYEFEKTYLQLIYFLEANFNYLRRDKIIRQLVIRSNTMTTTKANIMFQQRIRFSADERFLVYAKYLNTSPNPRNFNLKNSSFVIDSSVQKSIQWSLKKLCQLKHPETVYVMKSIILEMKKSQNSKNQAASFAYNPYLSPLVNRIITMYKSFSKNDDNISMRSSIQTTVNDQDYPLADLSPFCIRFFFEMYPYFNPIVLQKDLYFLRYNVQKYLPQLNLKLNRQHIGLENFCAKFMLSFFSTGLEEQITFTIWDFIMVCPNKIAGRLSIMLTLLIFFEKTDLQPIIPLHKFTKAIYENYQKFNFEGKAKKIVDQIADVVQDIYLKQNQRKINLSKIRSNKTQQLLLNNTFVKKILFNKERQHIVSAIGNNNNIVSLSDLPYKLPQPQYHRQSIDEVKIFLKSLFVFDTVSISNCTLTVRWKGLQSERIVLHEKSEYLNQFIRLRYPRKQLAKGKGREYDLPPIEFVISEKSVLATSMGSRISKIKTEQQNSTKFMLFLGYLPIVHLHKDRIYSEEVRLVMLNENQIKLSNKGQNILNVSVLLKSLPVTTSSEHLEAQDHNPYNNSSLSGKPNQSNFSTLGGRQYRSHRLQNLQDVVQKEAPSLNVDLHMQKEYHVNQQLKKSLLYDRLLDYSINPSTNSAVKQMQKMYAHFQNMKNPLDQFKYEKYQHLKIPAIGHMNTFPEVVMNSVLMIEHFQALLYETFSEGGTDSKRRAEKHVNQFKTKVGQLYQIFAKNTNFQMVFLTEIVIEAMLLDKNISCEQKIAYLYCLGKHYQNCGGKGLSASTVDYLISYIYKTYSWINPVPYTASGKGSILSGMIYIDGVKVSEEGLSITSILQDWAHIMKVKYGTMGILLGDEGKLNVLYSLIPNHILSELKAYSDVCRIQIIYQKDDSYYVYAATVSTANQFQIQSKGTKFLQKFPRQRQFHAGKIIHHCRNCEAAKISRNSSLANTFMPQLPCKPSQHNILKDYKYQNSLSVDPDLKQCQFQEIQLDTSSQIMYNCSNYIELESSKTWDFDEFKQIVYQMPMLLYLLGYSSLNEAYVLKQKASQAFQKANKNENYKTDIQKMRSQQQMNLNSYQEPDLDILHNNSRKSVSSSSSLSSKYPNQEPYQPSQETATYSDWILYRYQNCTQQWRKCQVLNIQNNIAQVALLSDKHVHKNYLANEIFQKYLPLTSSPDMLQPRMSTKSKPYFDSSKYPLVYRVPSFEVWSMDENLVVKYAGVSDRQKGREELIQQIKQEVARKNQQSRKNQRNRRHIGRTYQSSSGGRNMQGSRFNRSGNR